MTMYGIGAGVAGVGSYLWSKYGVKKPDKLGVSAMVDPTRQELLADLSRKTGAAIRKWGGRNLPGSAGGRAEIRHAEGVHTEALAKATSEASIMDYLMRYEETQAEKERFARLGGEFMRIPAYMLGRGAGTTVNVGELDEEAMYEELIRRMAKDRGILGMRSGEAPGRLPFPERDFRW